MASIDFRFFKAMREKLAAPFNPAEVDADGSPFYTLERLNILYNSDNLLNSEYCSEEFRTSLSAFFEAQKEEGGLIEQGMLQKQLVLLTKSAEENHRGEDYSLKFLKEYETLEDAKSYINSLKVMQSEGRKYIIIEKIVGDPINCDYQAYDSLIAELESKYEARDYYLNLDEIESYYGTWISDKKGFDLSYWHIFLQEYVACFTNTSEALENLLVKIGGKTDSVETMAEAIENTSWGNPLYRFKKLPIEQKKFWQDIVQFKGIDGVKLALNSCLSEDKTQEFFKNLTLEERISSEAQADSLMADITARITVNHLDILLSMLPESKVAQIEKQVAKHKSPEAFKLDKVTQEFAKTHGGFEFKEFVQLAKRFNMPSSIFRDVIEKELPKFNFTEDHVRDELTEALSLYSGNPLFDHIVEDKDFKFKINADAKESSVVLYKKADPTGLFAGKLTKCCQFYTGDSSNQAVMPIYTDPNAGLIVVKDKHKVKGVCFTWLCRNEAGEIDGIVIDSFEHQPEAGKAFLPTIMELSKILSYKGLNLYIGAGGATPSLVEVLDGVSKPAASMVRPKPLSDGFEPYYDSQNVYLINSKATYRDGTSAAGAMHGDEANYFETYVSSLSDAKQQELKIIFGQYDFKGDAENVIRCAQAFGYDLLLSLKLLAPIAGGSIPSANVTIPKLLALGEEKLMMIGSSKELIEKIFQSTGNQACLDKVLASIKLPEELTGAASENVGDVVTSSEYTGELAIHDDVSTMGAAAFAGDDE